MDEPIAAQRREITFRDLNPASLFALAVVVPVLSLISIWVWRERELIHPHLVFDLVLWTLLVGAVELLPAPAWRGIHVSLGFPILTAVAITYPPGWAAAVALIGSTDPAEFRHETTLLKAIFNRCQVALAVFFSSATFHFFASVGDRTGLVIAAALVASLVDYVTNFGIVVFATSLMYRTSVLRLARTLPRLSEFLVSYAGLAIVGVVLAELFSLPKIQFLAVLTVIAPLLFARQMFVRSHALEEAHVELTEREEILRELSNTMAEERADERLQIAGYLHDDLAQVLFRLSLQVDIARKLLDKGDVDDVRQQLDKIRESKQETSDRIRALIRDLHRSPLGAKGLAESLESFTDEVGRDSDIRFHRDVQDIDLPAPIALLVFHIAREGIMNAVKHADPTDVSVSVAEQGEDIVLQLEDNGSGFDAGAPGPEGHYGMAMMRERAKVGGGSLEVRSGVGEGTTITVRFPIALLQREPQPGTEPPSANGPERASPGTPGTTSRSAEGSRDSVPA
jgi:signal transduction histidine kinase